MDTPSIYFSIFILLYFVLYYFIIRGVYSEFNFRKLKKSPPNFLQYDQLLSQKIPFYRNLDEEGRNIFINLLIQISKQVEIKAFGNVIINQASKTLLIAPMAQISFGYKENVFLNVNEIRIFEGHFKIGKSPGMKGAFSPKGVLMFSWPDFLKGFEEEHDNYNLGLHECAHALKIRLNQKKEFNDFINSKLTKYKVQAQIVFAKMHKDSESFLRKYANVNKQEFFAVCVEHFYENPRDFKSNLPELYESLKKLLKVDLLTDKPNYGVSFEEDAYSIEKNFNINRFFDNLQNKKSTLAFLMVLSLVIGIPINLSLYQITYIQPTEYWSLVSILWSGGVFLAVFIHGFLLDSPNKNWLRLLNIEKLFISLTSVFGGTALFFLLNFLGKTSSIDLVKYEVSNYEKRNNRELTVVLKNNEYSTKPHFRTVNTLQELPNFIYVFTQKGLFGYDILRRVEADFFLDDEILLKEMFKEMNK